MPTTTDIFRDSIWQFWGVVISVVTLIVSVLVSIIIYLRSKSNKRLSYSVDSLEPVVRPRPGFSSRVHISFDGMDVPDVTIVSIRFTNTGNVAIRPEDYYEPVTIEFPGAAQVLDATIGEDNPRGNTKIQAVQGSSVAIEPCLLNSKWHFKATCLVAGYTDFNVHCKIVDVTRIADQDAERARHFRRLERLQWPLFGAMLVAVAAFVLWLFSLRDPRTAELGPYGVAVMASALLIGFGNVAITVLLFNRDLDTLSRKSRRRRIWTQARK